VIERHHAERAFTVPIQVLRDVRERACAFVPVTARHALPLARRARGVEDQREIVGVRVGRLAGMLAFSQQRVEGGRAALGVIESDARHVLRRAALHDGIRAHRFVDDRLHARVSHAVVEFVGLGAPVERHDHDARELAGPVQRRHFPAVLQHGEQPVVA
jgi:hypothetical protein